MLLLCYMLERLYQQANIDSILVKCDCERVLCLCFDVWEEKAFWYIDNDNDLQCLQSQCDIKFQTFHPLLRPCHSYPGLKWTMQPQPRIEYYMDPHTGWIRTDSFQLDIDKNQKVILKLLEFLHAVLCCRYGFVNEIPTHSHAHRNVDGKWLCVLDSYCSITTKEKSTDTYLKVAQKIFRLLCLFHSSLARLCVINSVWRFVIFCWFSFIRIM